MELAVVLVVVVLLFGVKRLPELGSGLGQGISNFKKSFREGSAIDVTPEKEKLDAAKEKGAEAVLHKSEEKTPVG